MKKLSVSLMRDRYSSLTDTSSMDKFGDPDAVYPKVTFPELATMIVRLAPTPLAALPLAVVPPERFGVTRPADHAVMLYRTS